MSERLEFRIHGMDCADEVAILRRALEPVVGVPERLAFDILRGKMSVDVGAPAVTGAQVVEAVRQTGMRAERWREVKPDAAAAGLWQRGGRTATTVLSGLLTVIGFLTHAAQAGLSAAMGSEGLPGAAAVPPASRLWYGAAIVCGGCFVARRAWYALRRLRPDMNLLMTVAVVGAVSIGQWFEAAVVAFLFALSLALESWSVSRARRAVEALLAIAPPTARIVAADGRAEEIPASQVRVGMMMLVRPGERIALDGTVRDGTSHINQAPITGESLPVEKAPGADVFAGTVNGDGALQVEVTRLVGDTTLAQIIRMVGEAQSRRAPSEQWVDRFAQVYTPSILAIAILVAVVPWLAGTSEPGGWVYRSLVLLVIGCPCALVISTPVSVVASLTAAARQGVLVKGGAFIEAPARLRAVALDKTGTLTRGVPEVLEVAPMAGHTEGELLEALAAMESHSDHPLARAIVAHTRGRGIVAATATDVQALQGRGITATIGGRPYWLGSHRYLEERGQETDDVHEQLVARSSAGRTVVVMGTADHVCGFVTLGDALREEAADAVQALRTAGVEHIVMLTGDNAATADRIGRATGLDEVQAELLPADKVAAIERLVARYGEVAMIGDGVNDAPAMGRATVGIAMGAAGSDAAIEAADIALMSDDLSRLAWLIGHARRTLRIIRQNVSLSLGVKVLFLVLTLLGHASLWAAIAADMGVSLAVIANALRLLGRRDGPAALTLTSSTS